MKDKTKVFLTFFDFKKQSVPSYFMYENLVSNVNKDEFFIRTGNNNGECYACKSLKYFQLGFKKAEKLYYKEGKQF